jgi:hypothetical protein
MQATNLSHKLTSTRHIPRPRKPSKMEFKPSDSVQQYLCKHVKRCDPGNIGEICVICLEPCSSERKCLITHCGHHYHDLCLLEHFKEHNFCPFDRRTLFNQHTIDAYDIFLDNDLTYFFSHLPDVVAKLQPFDYAIKHLMDKARVFDDIQITNHLRRMMIPRIIKEYGWWLSFTFGTSDEGDDSAEKRALTFSDEAIAYYVTAVFLDKIKSRLSLKLWLQLEKMRHRRAQWFFDHRPADGADESQEEWFLDAALPEHSFAKHIAHVFGRGDMAEVTYVEVAIEYADGGKKETGIVLTNPGKTLDLQFGNGKDGLRIQLLHGQILKITDWRATGTLSRIELDVKIEDGELFLKDPEGNKHTFIFKFD